MNALLIRTDALLNAVEEDLLYGRKRIGPTLRHEITVLASRVKVVVEPIRTNHSAHNALFDIQARLLHVPVKAGRAKNFYQPPARGWYPMPLTYTGSPLHLGSAEWWEYAQARVDRLEARWVYAVAWARKQPSPSRVRAMQRAWDDYYSALETLAVLPRP